MTTRRSTGRWWLVAGGWWREQRCSSPGAPARPRPSRARTGRLIRAGTAEQAQGTVDAFVGRPSTDVQENTVTTVRSGELDVQELSRWYPPDPQGLYQAMVDDRAATAIALLEIKSLDQDQYAVMSAQQVADALVVTQH